MDAGKGNGPVGLIKQRKLQDLSPLQEGDNTGKTLVKVKETKEENGSNQMQQLEKWREERERKKKVSTKQAPFKHGPVSHKDSHLFKKKTLMKHLVKQKAIPKQEKVRKTNEPLKSSSKNSARNATSGNESNNATSAKSRVPAPPTNRRVSSEAKVSNQSKTRVGKKKQARTNNKSSEEADVVPQASIIPFVGPPPGEDISDNKDDVFNDSLEENVSPRLRLKTPKHIRNKSFGGLRVPDSQSTVVFDEMPKSPEEWVEKLKHCPMVDMGDKRKKMRYGDVMLPIHDEDILDSEELESPKEAVHEPQVQSTSQPAVESEPTLPVITITEAVTSMDSERVGKRSGRRSAATSTATSTASSTASYSEAANTESLSGTPKKSPSNSMSGENSNPSNLDSLAIPTSLEQDKLKHSALDLLARHTPSRKSYAPAVLSPLLQDTPAPCLTRTCTQKTPVMHKRILEEEIEPLHEARRQGFTPPRGMRTSKSVNIADQPTTSDSPCVEGTDADFTRLLKPSICESPTPQASASPAPRDNKLVLRLLQPVASPAQPKDADLDVVFAKYLQPQDSPAVKTKNTQRHCSSSKVDPDDIYSYDNIENVPSPTFCSPRLSLLGTPPDNKKGSQENRNVPTGTLISFTP